jgi:hypothetical protein
MKKVILLLAGVIFFNGCALFHFFQPSAQNKILELADLKHLTLLGDPFLNVNSSLEDFSIKVDSLNTPYLVLRSTTDNLILYRYNITSLKWEIVSSNMPGAGGSSPILDISGTIPYVAYKDNSSWGQLFKFDSQISIPEAAMFTYLASSDLFDYAIAPSADQFIAFTTNIYGTNFIHVYDSSSGSWGPNPLVTNIFSANAPSDLTLLPDQDNNLFLLVNSGSGSYVAKFNKASVPQKFYFSTNIQLLSFNIDGQNNIYYFYNFIDIEYDGSVTNQIMRAYFDITPTTSPAILTPFTHEMFTNGMVFPVKQGTAASKNSPYFCYFLAGIMEGDMATLYIYRISPDGNYKKMCNVYSSKFNDTSPMIPKLAVAPDGALYVALLTQDSVTSNTSLSVYRME